MKTVQLTVLLTIQVDESENDVHNFHLILPKSQETLRESIEIRKVNRVGFPAQIENKVIEYSTINSVEIKG
jgi:hypothetical protein